MLVLVLALMTPGVAIAQVPADVWRTVAEKVEVGSQIEVRLRNGQRFRATLVSAGADTLLLQPRTRLPVPVQAVPYTDIAALQRRQEGGMGAAKAAAIGVATGAGTFFALLFITLATVSD
jgi:hypothetical protein